MAWLSLLMLPEMLPETQDADVFIMFNLVFWAHCYMIFHSHYGELTKSMSSHNSSSLQFLIKIRRCFQSMMSLAGTLLVVIFRTLICSSIKLWQTSMRAQCTCCSIQLSTMHKRICQLAFLKVVGAFTLESSCALLVEVTRSYHTCVVVCFLQF
jgi:L-asparagine transporter-like permease